MADKLAIISDFHMDSNHFSENELKIFEELLVEKGITHLHFAGDMSNDFHEITEPYLHKLNQTIPVSYNLGNHDMLKLSESEIKNCDFTVKKLGNKTLVAFHGWYDYSFYQGDTEKIIHLKNNFYFDRKIHRKYDDPTITDKILTRLNQVLSTIQGEIIVVMHFVPSANFIISSEYEKFTRFNAFLGSTRFHELFKQYPNISQVIFGHIHHRFEPTTIENVSYQARPLGYTYEWELVNKFFKKNPEFQISESRHLRKRYHHVKNLPEWLEFKKEHLAEEFQSALTIIEF
ncbi:MAG: metallophosphoesterase [Streptococcaceae bacterium]|jgi:putative phosphoesterase|nr:metallophosphoesterase [Streptococcaceae bacterium]